MPDETKLIEEKGKDEHFPSRWKKGESGNPGGKRRDHSAVKELARKNSRTALLVLISIMKDRGQKAVSRIAAANAVLDRGYGKVAQEVQVKGTGDKGQIEIQHMTKALSTDELYNMRAMLTKVGAVVIEADSVPLLDGGEDADSPEEDEEGSSGEEQGSSGQDGAEELEHETE